MENRCTNDGGAFREPCNRVNEPQAVYCVSCGAPTIFKQTKLISSPHDEGEKYFSEEHKDLDLFEHSFFRDDS